MFKVNDKNVKNKNEARELAINFQNWQSTQALSYSEVTYYGNFFARIGKKFNLIKEFRENGII